MVITTTKSTPACFSSAVVSGWSAAVGFAVRSAATVDGAPATASAVDEHLAPRAVVLGGLRLQDRRRRPDRGQQQHQHALHEQYLRGDAEPAMETTHVRQCPRRSGFGKGAPAPK